MKKIINDRISLAKRIFHEPVSATSKILGDSCNRRKPGDHPAALY
jgi:hypothetical protein